MESPPKFRMPEEVSMTDWNAKGRMYGTRKFTEVEIGFFSKFSERNKPFYSKLDNDAITPYFLVSSRLTKLRLIIYRLYDDWYLIENYVPSSDGVVNPRNFKYYICDEWEEVIGYLTTSDQFK